MLRKTLRFPNFRYCTFLYRSILGVLYFRLCFSYLRSSKILPHELISYLSKNKKALHPWLKQRVNFSGKSWTEVFGDDIYTDEIFMAYYYAKYVGRLCETARRYTQMPLYVNAAMNSRGRKPGQYPSAGPLAHLIYSGLPSSILLLLSFFPLNDFDFIFCQAIEFF